MENPPKDTNLIDTEEGLVLAKEVLDYTSTIDSIEDEELKNKINLVNEMEDIEKKILGLIDLSTEARKKGMPELSSLLNRHALDLDNQNSEILDQKNEQRVKKAIDMANYVHHTANARKNMKEKSEKELEEVKNKTPEIQAMTENHSAAVKKSIRKTLVSTLKSFFSF